AAHAQMRLDEDVIAIAADGRRRAHVDAKVAPGFPRARMGADRSLVVEEFRLLEASHRGGDLGDGERLRGDVRTRSPIALRRLMHPEGGCRVEIEHEIETLDAARVTAVEIDSADRPARDDALPVIAAAIEIDLEAPVDRLL